MQANLVRGLSNPLSSTSRTWPGTAELALLKLVGEVWSTSDWAHAVVGPAGVLLGMYLGTTRVRSVSDIASGLFLCGVALEYHRLSARIVPEAINFLANALVLLVPHSYKSASALPGCFPVLDFDRRAEFAIKPKAASTLIASPPKLSEIVNGEEVSEQDKVNLLGVTYALIRQFAELYKSEECFIELFEPFVELAGGLKVGKLSEDIQVCFYILSRPTSS